jgi:hypothetical protein
MRATSRILELKGHEPMSKERCFHSCFVTDVKTEGTVVQLKDSARGFWNLDLSDKDLAIQFKTWMEKVFLKGVPQTLTVFEYVNRSKDEVDFDFWIKKFCNIPTNE